MNAFLAGWRVLLHMMLFLLGGSAAVLLCAVCLIAMILLINSVVDRYTAYLSRKWHKRGKPPGGRLAKIIYDHDDSV